MPLPRTKPPSALVALDSNSRPRPPHPYRNKRPAPSHSQPQPHHTHSLPPLSAAPGYATTNTPTSTATPNLPQPPTLYPASSPSSPQRRKRPRHSYYTSPPPSVTLQGQRRLLKTNFDAEPNFNPDNLLSVVDASVVAAVFTQPGFPPPLAPLPPLPTTPVTPRGPGRRLSAFHNSSPSPSPSSRSHPRQKTTATGTASPAPCITSSSRSSSSLSNSASNLRDPPTGGVSATPPSAQPPLPHLQNLYHADQSTPATLSGAPLAPPAILTTPVVASALAPVNSTHPDCEENWLTKANNYVNSDNDHPNPSTSHKANSIAAVTATIGWRPAATARIDARTREVVVDWIVELCSQYSAGPHTVALAIGYLDGVLATGGNAARRMCLQETAAACVLVACKIEEVEAPPVSDLAYLCEGTPRAVLLEAERAVLNALRFRLTWQTAAGVVPLLAERAAAATVANFSGSTTAETHLSLSISSAANAHFVPVSTALTAPTTDEAVAGSVGVITPPGSRHGSIVSPSSSSCSSTSTTVRTCRTRKTKTAAAAGASAISIAELKRTLACAPRVAQCVAVVSLLDAQAASLPAGIASSACVAVALTACLGPRLGAEAAATVGRAHPWADVAVSGFETAVHAVIRGWERARHRDDKVDAAMLSQWGLEAMVLRRGHDAVCALDDWATSNSFC